MKRFLRELEACLQRLTPEQRATVASAYGSMIRGISGTTKVIHGFFRPSPMAALGLIGSFSAILGPGGEEKFLRDLRILAPTIGPHVTALVSAL